MRPPKQSQTPETRRSQALSYLSGRSLLSEFPKAITDPGQGGKFDKEGNVLQHPGNTFLCHIDQTSEFYQALCAFQDDLKAAQLANNYIFLPKPSFHMTVFCGVSGSPLGDDGWPTGMPNSATLDQVTQLFSKRLSNWSKPTEFIVRADGMSMPGTVRMVPATRRDAETLANLRYSLQEATGLYRVDIDSYEFHISLGYLERWYSEKASEEAMKTADRLFCKHLGNLSEQKLDPVEFCTFETMHHFERIRLLGG